jgi:hypothetical protein
MDAAVAVEEGHLELETLRLGFAGEVTKVQASHAVEASVERGELLLRFKPPVQLAAGDKLTVKA